VTLACAQALDRVPGVSSAIDLFPRHNDDVPGEYTVSFKPFGASSRALARKVKSIETLGTTPLGKALLQLKPTLLRRNVARRVFIVVTDGVPDAGDPAEQVIKDLEAEGIEVLGVGIGDGGKPTLKLIPKSVHINEVSELPDALERLFKSYVVGLKAA
jgi:cobaltochelatase CobT